MSTVRQKDDIFVFNYKEVVLLNGEKSRGTNSRERELILSFNRTRDSKLYEQIIQQYARLVEGIARRFLSSGEPLEDLTQEGWIGFMTAITFYNPSKNTKFSTYATHFVIGQIKHYLRDKGRIIKVPAWLQELTKWMRKHIEILEQELGRPVSLEDMLLRFPEDSDQIVKAWGLVPSCQRAVSLDELLEGENGESVFGAYNSSDDKTITKLHNHADLTEALDRLDPLQRTVVDMYYYQDLNLTEIAKKLGISCNYASHLRICGIQRLHFLLTQDEGIAIQQNAARRKQLVGGKT